MSRTPSVGVVGPGHWVYVATVMAERLTAIVAARAIKTDIPEGVLRAAEEFLDLALESAGEQVPQNPPASIANFLIATDALRTASQGQGTPQKPAEQLQGFASFLKRLRRRRDLKNSEVETAADLRRFFEIIRDAGESETYEATVRFPHLGVRFF